MELNEQEKKAFMEWAMSQGIGGNMVFTAPQPRNRALLGNLNPFLQDAIINKGIPLMGLGNNWDINLNLSKNPGVGVFLRKRF